MTTGNQYDKKVSEQDILKVFDAVEAPVLTASDLAEELPLTRQGANYRLNQMHEKGLVDRKETGARAVVWWATVAPRLSEEAIAAVEQSREEIKRGDTVSLEEL